MTHAAHIHDRLQALSAGIVQAFPQAVLGAVDDEAGVALSSTSVRLPNEVVLSVASDIDHPDSKFMVMRVGHPFPARLPFEQAFEDGFGVSEQLDVDGVFALVRAYASLPGATGSVH